MYIKYVIYLGVVFILFYIFVSTQHSIIVNGGKNLIKKKEQTVRTVQSYSREKRN